MIVRDVENDLGRCLASVYRLADEIVVGDTGSTDTTRAIAESYGARVIDVAPIEDQPEGFAGARNAVLDACSGDWFLWIDADEILQHGWKLRGFLDTAIFHGYVLHQTHVYLDGPPTFDVPQRVFRLGRGVRFYGCVHEQPQAGDPNVDIAPALDLSDPVIAHTGYLTEDEREEKRVTRNKPLLLRDQQAFPTRELGKVLLLREAVIEADHHRARHGGELTPRARIGYQHAINLFVRYFDDPGHKFAKIARPWYEAALRHLRHGWEAEVSLFGKPGGLQGARAKPEMIWVRDGVEFQRLMEHRIKDSVAKMAPVTFRTEPFEPTAASREVVNG
jgi:glycosyltransferase involved in cell wall biosynthesis